MNNTIKFSTPGDIYNATPPRILFGTGSIGQIGTEVERLGATRALVVSSPGRGGTAERIAADLGARCAGVLPEAVSQVPIELARRSSTLVRELGADCLISYGGGAAIGLAKAVALELGMPIIAVPTTYAGSEMTGFCGITIDGIKRMHTSMRMIASAVVYDPELTLTVPATVSAASAMNALAHCIDAVVVATCSPIMRMAAAAGAREISQSIARVVRDPSNLEARTQALYGAHLGGAALTGGFALQHGVAHVLGGSFGVPHGLAHALVLPHVAAFHAKTVPHLMEPVAAAMGVATADLGAAVFDLLAQLQLPLALKDIDFNPAWLPRAAQITVDTDDGANPVPVTLAVAGKILDDAYLGRPPA